MCWRVYFTENEYVFVFGVDCSLGFLVYTGMNWNSEISLTVEEFSLFRVIYICMHARSVDDYMGHCVEQS